MKKSLCLLILIFPVLLQAQTARAYGINWYEGLSWDQAKARAKMENKYLFIDCFATWCQPCKRMDNEVYLSKDIAEFVNENFVAVKVQMDTTENDDSQVKNWYLDASMISVNFNIQSFPTFLFFDQSGIPVHKAVGFLNTKSFKGLLKNVFNPNKQYYTLIRNFKPGNVNISELKGLIRAFEMVDNNLASKMALDYLQRMPKHEFGSNESIRLMADFQENDDVKNLAINYINRLKKKSLMLSKNIQLICWLNKKPEVKEYVGKLIGRLNRSEVGMPQVIKLMIAFNNNSKVHSAAEDYINRLGISGMFLKENIELMNKYTDSSHDKGFSFFYDNAYQIDSIMGQKNYSQAVVDRVIELEEILPIINERLKNNIEPNWDSLVLAVEKKYPNYGDRNVLWANLVWQKNKNNLPQYINCVIVFFDRYKNDITNWLNSYERNNFAWEYIFLRSKDPKQIGAGIRWMRDIVKRYGEKHPTYIDTYANLLYKVGQKEEAIALQRKACQLDPNDKSFQQNLKRMENDEPTWIVSH